MTAILVLIAAASATDTPSETPPDSASVLRPSRSAGRVDGVIAGTEEELYLLGHTLGESLSRQGLWLGLTGASLIIPEDVTRAIGQTESVVARFRLDLTSPPLAKLYLTDGERRRVYVRWLSLARGLDPVAIELLRFVIESSIEAIRAGRTIGVSREEYETSLAAAEPAQPAVQLVAAAAYEGTRLGEGEYQQGPAVSLSVRLPRLWFGASLLYRLPITIGGDALGARLVAGGLRITAAVPVVTTSATTFALGAGAGIDAIRIRPRATASDLAGDLVADPPFWATTPVLRAFGAVEHFFGRISVAATVGLDLDLLAERYVVADPAGTEEVFVPSRFRPVAALLVGVRP